MTDEEKIEALAGAVSMIARYLDEITNTRFEAWVHREEEGKIAYLRHGRQFDGSADASVEKVRAMTEVLLRQIRPEVRHRRRW